MNQYEQRKLVSFTASKRVSLLLNVCLRLPPYIAICNVENRNRPNSDSETSHQKINMVQFTTILIINCSEITLTKIYHYSTEHICECHSLTISRKYASSARLRSAFSASSHFIVHVVSHCKTVIRNYQLKAQYKCAENRRGHVPHL